MLVRGRVDEVKGITDTVLEEWLTTVGTDLVLVHHTLPHGNPHYHFYLDATYKSVQAMHYQWRKMFHFIGPNDWSIKPCSPDRKQEYWQYLFNNKHGNKFRLVKAFTDMTEYRTKAEAVSADFEERRKEKQKKHSGYDISMELAEWMRTMDYTDSKNYHLIVKHAIKLHSLYKKSFCLFSLERVVITAMGETAPDLIAMNVGGKIAKRLAENNFF